MTLRLVELVPGERFRVLPVISGGKSAAEVMAEIRTQCAPTVRRVQRRQRLRVLSHKHGRAVGFALYLYERALGWMR